MAPHVAPTHFRRGVPERVRKFIHQKLLISAIYEYLPVHYHVCSFDSYRVQRFDGRCRMSETNKAIYSRVWQELMNTRNLDIVDEMFAPNYVLHDPHFPMRGREALKRFVTALHNGFADIRLTIDDLIAEGNKVVKRFTLTCTHTGAFRGIPPSGKRLTLTGLTLGRIAHGQILEEWEGTDWLGWQQQLRIILEPVGNAPMVPALPWLNLHPEGRQESRLASAHHNGPRDQACGSNHKEGYHDRPTSHHHQRDEHDP